MGTDQIKEALDSHHLEFTRCINELPEEKFLATPNDKWSAGQQMAHIHMSVVPVAKLMSNKTVMLEKFGKLDRPSRSYENLVKDYLSVLSTGVKAGPRFTPEVVGIAEKSPLIAGVNRSIASIITNLESFSEQELEELVIPHPVMGPFTLREMLMFTIYHVQHHLKSVRENLADE